MDQIAKLPLLPERLGFVWQSAESHHKVQLALVRLRNRLFLDLLQRARNTNIEGSLHEQAKLLGIYKMSDFFHSCTPSALIRVQGEDTFDYLQSQLTIDMSKLDAGRFRFGLRLDKKGKVMAGIYVIP